MEAFKFNIVIANKTTDLSLFNFLPQNRATKNEKGLNNSNVLRVKKLLKEKGFDPNQPIVCCLIDGILYVLDGQHRVLACIELEMEAYFIVLPINNMRDAIEYCKSVNNTKKKWDIMDYVNSIINDPEQAETKRLQYQMILAWSKKYNVAPSYLMDISIGEGSTKAGGTLKNDLDFTLKMDSVEILEFAYNLAIRSNIGVKLMATKSFVRCVAMMLRNDVYKKNIAKFEDKIKNHRFEFLPKEADSNEIVLTKFEEVLNKGLSYKIDLRNKKIGLRIK
jgi:hypothetical protein